MAARQDRPMQADARLFEGPNGTAPMPRPSQLTLFLGASLCLLASFTLFHEFGRSFIKVVPNPPLYEGLITCILHSTGTLIGAAAMATRPVSQWTSQHGGAFLRRTSWALALAAAGYLYAFVGAQSALGLCLFGITASLLCSMLVVFLICQLQHLEVSTIAKGLALCVSCCAVVNYLAFPAVLHLLPVAACFLLNLAFAVGAAVLLTLYSRNPLTAFGGCPENSPDGKSAETRTPFAKALPLVAHLTSYGFAFGVLHATIGVFQLAGPGRYTLELIGALLAAALVLATYIRPVPTAREVWTNMRRLTFPLLTGFVITSALLHSVLTSVFADGAFLYYGCLFVLGCVFMMHDTVVSPMRIVGLGISFLCAGLIPGELCGFIPFVFERTSDQMLLTVSIMTAFIAVTIGTFWIGDDHALRTWWGLRRAYTAKQYQDRQMRQRCEQVARTFNLSERELEVLLLLAQGRRATQIKDDLFISINTVRVHTRNIYNKLDVHSVKQLTDIVESVVL